MLSPKARETDWVQQLCFTTYFMGVAGRDPQGQAPGRALSDICAGLKRARMARSPYTLSVRQPMRVCQSIWPAQSGMQAGQNSMTARRDNSETRLMIHEDA